MANNQEVKRVEVVATPVATERKASKFSISEAFNKKEEVIGNLFDEIEDEGLPNNDFTEQELQTEWQQFLRQIQLKDIVIFNAISSFQLSKPEKDVIHISYPSEIAKVEFDKVQAKFFKYFKQKVNNFRIKLEYKMNVAMKKEMLTKRKIFDKLVEKNPLLQELDNLFKFDFS